MFSEIKSEISMLASLPPTITSDTDDQLFCRLTNINTKFCRIVYAELFSQIGSRRDEVPEYLTVPTENS